MLLVLFISFMFTGLFLLFFTVSSASYDNLTVFAKVVFKFLAWTYTFASLFCLALHAGIVQLG